MTQSGFTSFGNLSPEPQNTSTPTGALPSVDAGQRSSPPAATPAGKPQAASALLSLEQLQATIEELPLWIKQVIYAELREKMEKHFVRRTLETFNREHLLPLFIPRLTPLGLKNVSQPDPSLSPLIHRLLYLAKSATSIVNMCISEQWTLAECSQYLLHAFKYNLIHIPASPIVYATIEYLAGSIRLGNYMVKIGRLSLKQLEEALKTQHYISEAMGEKTSIADVLINLGYINKDDAEGILFLKAESQKVYPPRCQMSS
ncbi:MAG: hypothetical protein VKK59_04145 [Vampirovibrionales bacterium]|nr:hypothetical protein [Vampirovibrionales bacterium]